MGDTARFREFAKLIHNFYPADLRIADVASGNGKLQAALRSLGHDQIVSWDIRHRNAKPRRGYHYGLFDYRNAPRGYDLVVGMHPDEATDHIVMYAGKHRVPFVVCPCCVKPSAMPFKWLRSTWNSATDKAQWFCHLALLAEQNRMQIDCRELSISGDKFVLMGKPI